MKVTQKGKFYFCKRMISWSVRSSKYTPNPEAWEAFIPNKRELCPFPIDSVSRLANLEEWLASLKESVKRERALLQAIRLRNALGPFLKQKS